MREFQLKIVRELTSEETEVKGKGDKSRRRSKKATIRKMR